MYFSYGTKTGHDRTLRAAVEKKREKEEESEKYRERKRVSTR